MNENIDLTKILKDCPDGWELYSTLFGEVKFVKCVGLHLILVRKKGNYYYFTQNGMFIFEGTVCEECALFPSKEQRDWSKFIAPWHKKEKFDPKTLQPFDKVLCKNGLDMWRCDLFSSYVGTYSCSIFFIFFFYTYCIHYNEDTKHLVGTRNKSHKYYRYWEE